MLEPRATLEEASGTLCEEDAETKQAGLPGPRGCPMGSRRKKPHSELGPKAQQPQDCAGWIAPPLLPPGSLEPLGRLQQSRLEEAGHPPIWQRPHGGHLFEAGAVGAEVAGRLPGESACLPRSNTGAGTTGCQGVCR